MKSKLGTPEQEAARCKAAFRGYGPGCLVLHLHHEIGCEILTEPIAHRIAYILSDKTAEERALRLRLMRPVPRKAWAGLDRAHWEWGKADAELGKACAAWDRAHWEWDKACAEWGKANWEWCKAGAAWGKACAAWLSTHHATACQLGCPWSGETIFPRCS